MTSISIPSCWIHCSISSTKSYPPFTLSSCNPMLPNARIRFLNLCLCSSHSSSRTQSFKLKLRRDDDDKVTDENGKRQKDRINENEGVGIWEGNEQGWKWEIFNIKRYSLFTFCLRVALVYFYIMKNYRIYYKYFIVSLI